MLRFKNLELTTVNQVAIEHTIDMIVSLLMGRKQGFTKLKPT